MAKALVLAGTTAAAMLLMGLQAAGLHLRHHCFDASAMVPASGIASSNYQRHRQPRGSSENYTGGMSEHPACRFFRSNAGRHAGGVGRSEIHWGADSSGLCMHSTFRTWLTRSKSNCFSCLNPGTNICNGQHTVNFHMFMTKLDDELPHHSLLSMQAYLMTQDLDRARLMLWSEHPESLVTNATAWFFKAFSDHITLAHFNYTHMIQGTIWQQDPFFGNVTLVKQALRVPSAYSDVVRLVILHNHGGLWVDTDVFLFQDITHLLLTSYQFTLRFMNNHILFMQAGSRLTQRMMWLATTMPANHPHLKQELIEKRCKRNGYYQMNATLYGYTDMYNGCLLRELVRLNNTGPPDAILYDMPLGWWDPDWAGCLANEKGKRAGQRGVNLTDDQWLNLTSNYLSLHSRYPRDKSFSTTKTAVGRSVSTVDGFFRACRSPHCLPVQGMVLAAYDGMWERPKEFTLE